MSRKTKYSERIKMVIVAAIEKGHFVSDACKLANIDPDTFYSWKHKSEDGIEPYVGFSDAINEAEVKAIDDALDNITEAGREDWRASAWFLERRSQKWNKNMELEISGNAEKPVEVELRWADDLGKDKKEKKE